MLNKYLNDYQIIERKTGYLTNNNLDTVFLLGKTTKDSPHIVDIKIVVVDSNGKYYEINPKENSGYEPTITIDSFTSLNDSILLSVNSGGSGGFSYYYIYNFQNNDFEIIFDFEQFNNLYHYNVIYQDDYQVLVINKELNKQYLIDLRNKDKDYLDSIYLPNGKLKKPIQGWVSGVNTLYPIDIGRSEIMSLAILQRIAGLYNADELGLIATILSYDNNKFITNNQYLMLQSY